jgi:glycosyltransferase involved in cell wall biosynthesis
MIAPTSFFSDYGCSVRILEETRILQSHRHNVTICTYRNGQDLPGIPIVRTASIPFREHYEVGSSLHKVAFDFLLFWTVLYRAIRRRPDVIHAHMHEGALIGLVASGLLRIPMIFDFQGSMTSEMLDHKFLTKGSPFYRLLRWLEERVDRRARVILTSSENARRLLIEEFDCRPERVLPLVDCVDAEQFRPALESEKEELAARRASLRIPDGRKIVVYLGLLAPYQGTDALLQAAEGIVRERQDVHFLIMGFPSVDHYRAVARGRGLAAHTTFTGKIPYHQARDYLALGDVAVAPKLSATEGSGKILNYMAMGLPTVTFDTPVSREYLGDKGIYARAGDAESLAQALLRTLAMEPDRARALSRELRQAAIEDYSWERAVHTIRLAYKTACQAPSNVL